MKFEEMKRICFIIEAQDKFSAKRDDNQRKIWISSLYELFKNEAAETVLSAVRLAQLESNYEPTAAQIQRGIDTIRKRKNLRLAEEVFDTLRKKVALKWDEEKVIKALHNARLPEAIRAVKQIGWHLIEDPHPHLVSDIKRRFINTYDTIVQRTKQEQQFLEIADPQIAKLIADIPMKRLQ